MHLHIAGIGGTFMGGLAAIAKAEAERKKLPLEIELIGVTEDGGVLVAALYDRRSDRLLLVKNGDEIEGAKVSALTRDRVELTRDGGSLVLARTRESR